MFKPKIPAPILVIAQSARMLVQLASNAGIGAVAIDCFGDDDTRQLAMAFRKIDSLGLKDLGPAVEVMHKDYGFGYVIYGSGFETQAESLFFLERHWFVLGNSAAMFIAFQDKREFFRRIGALKISHPETRFSPPVDDRGWLVKPVRGQGGLGVRHYESGFELFPAECYWQRFLEGKAFSLTFIAYDGGVEMLGFNRQWCRPLGDGQDFVFAGIANHAEVAEAHKVLLGDWLARICGIYPFRGLGSLDFIVSDGRCYLLEVNPRIPASAQFYGDRVLNSHIRACLGHGENGACQTTPPAAYQVLYADRDVRLVEDVDWPEWVVDRPVKGSIIGKGQPICSIIAAGKSPMQAAERLRRRQQVIEKLLNTGS